MNINQDKTMSYIHFSNYQLEENTEYFIYIGELKNYGLNVFLKEALSRIYGRNIDFIAIVPDVFEQYNYDNLIVINPLIESFQCRYGSNVHCRVSAKEFMTAVSENRKVRSLIDRILKRQSSLFLYMYESLCEMTLDDIPGVSILGPDKQIATKVNNKAFQIKELNGIVPVIDFRICHGYANLIQTTDSLWETWPNGIFVTKEYSAAGINSIVALSSKDIQEKFGNLDTTYVITRFVPHRHDPTVLAVAAGKDEIYIAGVADQNIENGNRFTGSTFPTVLPPSTIFELEQQTRKIGSWLAEQGYRGIFGCDFIVTEANDILFLEINARKQGTTLEFCCMLEHSLPQRAPNLTELEFYAVTESLFPLNTVEMTWSSKNLHWGTFNYKIHQTVKTQGYLPQNVGEREAFKKIATGNLKKDFLILEHAGADFVVAQGAFIARVVALGHDHDSVAQGIYQGCRTIELTFAKEPIMEKEHV